MIKESLYYDLSKPLAYNATYNFIAGARGLGKTYSAKRLAIKRFIKRGDMFIYLRRYKDEIRDSKTSFFSDISHEFPDKEFRVIRNEAQIKNKGSKEWETMGYFVPLSTAQRLKSVSYPKVTTIIFDEFIIEKGMVRYIPSEFMVFNNFYSTVDRWKDKTTVLFLANSVSIDNPYFVGLDIHPDEMGEINVTNDGFVLCHFPEAKEFQTEVYKTRFGKFISDTEYADYAVGNKFSDAGAELVKGKSTKARYRFTLETKKGLFSVWFDSFTGEFFLQEKRPKEEIFYTIAANKMSEEKVLLENNNQVLQILRTAFRQAKMYFDKPSTRNAFIDIFRGW